MVDAKDLDGLLTGTPATEAPKKAGRPRKNPAPEAKVEEKPADTEKTPEEPKVEEKKEEAPADTEKTPEEPAKVETPEEPAKVETPAEPEKAPEAEYTPEDEEDESADVIAVQFLTGSFTTQYGVQPEGSVLRYTVGTREYNRTKDSSGDSWLDLIDNRKAQIKRFGAHVFQRFED